MCSSAVPLLHKLHPAARTALPHASKPKKHCFSSELKALPGSRNKSRATCPGAEQQPGRMEPSVLPAWSHFGHTKVFKTQPGEGSNCHFNTVFPSAVSQPQPVCIAVNFHMLCEPKCRQFMLCSICTMTFYWKELETQRIRNPLRAEMGPGFPTPFPTLAPRTALFTKTTILGKLLGIHQHPGKCRAETQCTAHTE